MRHHMLTLLTMILLLFAVNPVNAGKTTHVVIDHQEMQQILDDFLAEQSLLLPQVELRLTSVQFPAP
ncbi:MAG TPA: hypothetical protein VKN62_07715, partial [Pelovirga sp.]|nr:hypothetical protein [Pelovirga sp.]